MRKKGWTLEVTRQAIADVSARARQVGLAFDYDRTVVANTFDAHRLAHYAASAGKGDDVQERLFKAYFVDGQNITDHTLLTKLAVDAGLPADAVRDVLSGTQFAADVHRDIEQAQPLSRPCSSLSSNGLAAAPTQRCDRDFLP